jgi:hypothetical protein
MTVVKDLERLTRTPEGVRTFIERPDGTRLHCIALGEGPTVVLAPDMFESFFSISGGTGSRASVATVLGRFRWQVTIERY